MALAQQLPWFSSGCPQKHGHAKTLNWQSCSCSLVFGSFCLAASLAVTGSLGWACAPSVSTAQLALVSCAEDSVRQQRQAVNQTSEQGWVWATKQLSGDNKFHCQLEPKWFLFYLLRICIDGREQLCTWNVIPKRGQRKLTWGGV